MFKTICHNTIFVSFAAALSLMAFGCTGAIQRDAALERNWGRAYETQRHLQTANPVAGQALTPAATMDGTASDLAMKAYRESFSPEEGAETVNIIKLR
jgi:hypothetical protein